MSCIWQGDLSSVTWPHHDPLLVDLNIEIWWSNESQSTKIPRLDDVDLHFEKFVRIKHVPLWAICGPEMSVMTRSSVSHAFFTEFASVEEDVVMRIAVNKRGPDRMFSHVLIFCVSEGSSKRIAARPLNIDVRMPNRLEAEQISRPTEEKNTEPNAEITPRPAVKDSPVPDVKKSLQQIILGALRLRGIRSGSPEFKKTYFSVLYLVETALGKMGNAEVIGMHTIHEKVEAILSVID